MGAGVGETVAMSQHEAGRDGKAVTRQSRVYCGDVRGALGRSAPPLAQHGFAEGAGLSEIQSVARNKDRKRAVSLSCLTHEGGAV